MLICITHGSCIRFWLHVLCGEAALKASFPDLYLIAQDKEALVSDYLDSSTISVHWNPMFTKAVQGWELESLNFLLNMLYSLRVHSGEADRML